MNTFIQRGHRLTYTNSTGSDIAAGAVVRLASGTTGYCGVAVTDIANGATGEVEVEGVHELTKVAGQAFTVGQVLYWDNTNSRLTSTATSTFTRIGRSAKISASAATTAQVKLNE